MAPMPLSLPTTRSASGSSLRSSATGPPPRRTGSTSRSISSTFWSLPLTWLQCNSTTLLAQGSDPVLWNKSPDLALKPLGSVCMQHRVVSSDLCHFGGCRVVVDNGRPAGDAPGESRPNFEAFKASKPRWWCPWKASSTSHPNSCSQCVHEIVGRSTWFSSSSCRALCHWGRDEDDR